MTTYCSREKHNPITVRVVCHDVDISTRQVDLSQHVYYVVGEPECEVAYCDSCQRPFNLLAIDKCVKMSRYCRKTLVQCGWGTLKRGVCLMRRADSRIGITADPGSFLDWAKTDAVVGQDERNGSHFESQASALAAVFSRQIHDRRSGRLTRASIGCDIFGVASERRRRTEFALCDGAHVPGKTVTTGV